MSFNNRFQNYLNWYKKKAQQSNSDLVPSELSDVLVQKLLQLSKNFTICKSIYMFKCNNATPIPYSLFPTPFPAICFDQALKLSTIFTDLIAKITLDTVWLLESIKRIGELDLDFTQKLLNIAYRCYASGQRSIRDDLKAIFIRSDYIIGDSSSAQPKLQQVEVNTISLSFVSLANVITNFHRASTKFLCPSENIPNNSIAQNFVKCLLESHQQYIKKYEKPRHFTSQFIKTHGSKFLGHALLFVVNADEKNIFDQYLLEFDLVDSNLHIIRMTFEQLVEFFNQETENRIPMLHILRCNSSNYSPNLSKHPEIGALCIYDCFLKGFWEISIVYYRTGYDPADYLNSESWLMREVLEMSNSIKLPNVLSHLAGTKKIQSLWYSEKELAKFVENEKTRNNLFETFVEQVDISEYSENKYVQDLVDQAIKNPEEFVLKPQREGGRNNLYNAELKKALVCMKSEANPSCPKSYILMRKIKALTNPIVVANKTNSILEPFEIITNCISELGTFGFLLEEKQRIFNNHIGHLLRSKNHLTDEGGVSAGFAFLDSPLLV